MKVSPAGLFSDGRTCPGANRRVSRPELLFPHQWETNFPQRLQLDPSTLLPGPGHPCCVSSVWKADFDLISLSPAWWEEYSSLIIMIFSETQFVSSVSLYRFVSDFTGQVVFKLLIVFLLWIHYYWCCLFVLQLEELVAVGRGREHERSQGLGRRSVRAGSVLQHLWWDGTHGNYCHHPVSVLHYF